MLLTGSGIESFVQFMVVLLLFCVVLVITYLTTRYIVGIQKMQQDGTNISVVETSRIAPNKYIQIVKLGEKYIAVAVCKDTVTKLTELSEDELIFFEKKENGISDFAQILEKVKQRKQKK